MTPFLTAAFTALPLLLLLLLMVAAHWSAARAGAIALLAALGVALSVFGYGEEVYAELGRGRAVAGALAEAAFSTFSIFWILLPALGNYHLQSRTGAPGVRERALDSRGSTAGALGVPRGLRIALPNAWSATAKRAVRVPGRCS